VVKLLQNFKPDVVHVEAEPHTLTLALLAYLKPRFQYSLVAFTWENIYRRGRKPMAWLEPFSLRRVDWMITGNHEASQVIKWRGYNGPTSVVPQVGIDTAYFQKSSVLPELFEKCADGFKIGFVGRLVPEKGVLDLWEAFRPLAEQGYLLLFGEGPLRETLQQQALAAGLRDRVLLPGFIPHQQISAYFQGLDVLVLPSQTRPHWKEQFGQVLIEAMLSGVPVIGSDSGAIPEVIGEAGLIFPEQDVERLRQQLIYLLETPEKQKQLADAGKKRVLTHFTEDAVAQLTLAVYQEVLGRREKSK
jgi:glycosyltransferase involved in cell wall biosynthesis